MTNKTEHYHCPNDCEHPQPFEHEGKWYCGRCLCIDKQVVECVECTPAICNE